MNEQAQRAPAELRDAAVFKSNTAVYLIRAFRNNVDAQVCVGHVDRNDCFGSLCDLVEAITVQVV